MTVSARIWSCWSLSRLAYHGDLRSLDYVSCFSLRFSRALAASCVLYNRTEHSQGFSICLILICIYWPFFGLVSFCSLRSFRLFCFGRFVLLFRAQYLQNHKWLLGNELRQISDSQHQIKHGFLKSYGKLEMCFICGADTNLSSGI